jgi:hypothetical protein
MEMQGEFPGDTLGLYERFYRFRFGRMHPDKNRTSEALVSYILQAYSTEHLAEIYLCVIPFHVQKY